MPKACKVPQSFLGGSVNTRLSLNRAVEENVIKIELKSHFHEVGNDRKILAARFF